MQSSFFTTIVWTFFFLVLKLNLKVEFILGANNVREIIETREDLTTIAGDKFLRGTDVMAYMGNLGNKNLLFFAPQNLAIANMSAYLRSQLLSASASTMDDLFSYHLALNSNMDPSKLNDGTKLKLLTKYKSSYIFVNKVPVPVTSDLTDDSNNFNSSSDAFYKGFNLLWGGVIFVNNAKILIANLWSANGIVHIIDEMFVDVGPTNNVVGGLNAMDYMKSSPDLKELSTLYAIYQSQADLMTIQFSTPDSNAVSNYLAYVDSFCTLFAPSSAFISAYRTRNPDLYFKIAGASSSTMKTFETQIIREFQATILSLQSEFLLSKLKVVGGAEYVVPADRKYTLFAPTAAIFNYIDYSNDASIKAQQFSMTLMPGVIDLSSVTGSFKVNTLREGYQATISRIGQDVFVEVDHVTARVVQSNICARNGLIHKIDKILGVPEAMISEYLMRYPIYRQVYNTLQDTGLLTLFNNPTNQLTLLAPNATALSNLDQMFQGQQNKKKFRDLVSRHIIKSVVFLDESKLSQSSMAFDTYNGQVVASFSNGAFFISVGEQKVKVIQSNMRMTNGVIHVVDNFLPYQASTADQSRHRYIPSYVHIAAFSSFVFTYICR
ncbi:hypothetical protein HELRODRAFT_193188 [Helobdella robusta]|uniref:FAS1 domain-containing protein n=1 Tax=Helobdella robusta TaxID=6412 RepID=T1FUQ3_HELRO|nr:hypothetical protein HELRODRAFT_193188 [Helobdella robusta]ESN97740.1 hypothetical protein HELRODRAFT_193188 [Helobdella robusta]